jgi:hypothetical protein
MTRALLLIVGLGVSACEAHATYERGSVGDAVRADTLVVREDSARGVACYQVAYRVGLSCVKVRP